MNVRAVLFDRAMADRGASAIVIALSLLLLMGFAAIAVDSGILFDDRRQQQSAADGGALAAVQFADTTLTSATCSGSGTARAACRGAEEAIAVVNGTLPSRYSLADWTACADPNKPARFTINSSQSTCISYTSNFQEARVVLPGTDVDTSFGNVVGVASKRVTAGAEATFELDQSGRIVPWAIGPSGGGANYACVMANSSSNLDVAPCNGPTSGNFGKLDVSLYGNSTIETPRICGNSNSSTKMAVNLIVGADHPLETEATSMGTVHDFTNCPIITNAVDQLRTQTGNSAGGIEDGFFNGVTVTTPNYEGSLMCKDGDPGEYGNMVSPVPCVTVGNQFPETVDHTPLWHFITPGAASESAGACTPSISTQAAMEACLAAWRAFVPTPHTIALFSPDIEFATRFAAVPLLDSDPSNGSGDYNITEFIPIYTDTIYLKCNANTCDIAHSPGIASTGACPNPIASAKSCGWTSNGNKNIVAVTSYMLRVDMLPIDMQDRFPNRPGTLVFNLSR